MVWQRRSAGENLPLTVSKPGFGSQVRPVPITGAQVRQKSFQLGPPILEFTAFSYNSSTQRANLAWTSEAAQTFRVEHSDDLNAWFPHISNRAS